MVQGSWFGDLLPVSFFLFSFSVFILFFLPYERVRCPGLGTWFHPLCLDSSLFFFTLLTFLSSVLMRADPTVAGIGIYSNTHTHTHTHTHKFQYIMKEVH